MTMQKNGKRSPWDTLNKYPPVLVRLTAKTRPPTTRALTDQEVAIKAGIALPEIKRVSKLTSWDDVPIGLARSFCNACNFDPFSYKDRNRLTAYTRKGTYAYLRNSPQWDSVFVPLIKILQNAQIT